mmetsp:Transcript_442/g.530  ORF Transcript_442/g.530 Transcript_442/m.530 type:complete len:264 (+) Transcript_442:441-1232(+)
MMANFDSPSRDKDIGSPFLGKKIFESESRARSQSSGLLQGDVPSYANGLGGIVASGMWAPTRSRTNTLPWASRPSFEDEATKVQKLVTSSSSSTSTERGIQCFQPEEEPAPFQVPAFLQEDSQQSVTDSSLPHVSQPALAPFHNNGGAIPRRNTFDSAALNEEQKHPSVQRGSNNNNNNGGGRQRAGSGKGDWICGSCGNTNYAWRHVCNMRKCRAPKPGHLNVEPSPPGSWACLSCGNLNYAERTVCNMRKCRAPRPNVKCF